LIDKLILWAQKWLGKQYLEANGELGPDFATCTTAPQATHICDGGDKLKVETVFSHLIKKK
jgi:hypothetical protein